MLIMKQLKSDKDKNIRKMYKCHLQKVNHPENAISEIAQEDILKEIKDKCNN